MNIEINIHLVKAIADMAIFLEFSDENVVDDDAAIAVLEQMGAELQLMDEATKSSFIAKLAVISNDYSDDQSDFVSGLAESLGLL